MIEKIAHIADIHLRKAPTRNSEYVHVFKKLIDSLRENKPDRIVIVGDIVHDYLALGTEQSILARKFLKSLSKISKVVITRGNHDYLKTNLNRNDSIEALISGMDLNNITYYGETGFFRDENVIWSVWHHGSKTKNPWKTKEGRDYLKEKPSETIFIDLFHDPILNSKTQTGFSMKSESLFRVADLKGDYSFLGDIHLKQFLNKEKTIAYSGSLLAQDFSEGDDKFHGYLLWDILNKNVHEIEIPNNHHRFVNIKLTQKTDFTNLDFTLPTDIKEISLRLIWNTLPSVRCTENEERIKAYIREKLGLLNVKLFNKNGFIESEKIEIQNTETIKNIMNQEVQHKIFIEYLTKIGLDETDIDKIIDLDREISSQLDNSDSETYEWDIVRFGGVNFMSYEKFDIDWKDKLGLFQIAGKNTSGKTTLAFKFIPFMLFGKTLETENRMKHGDVRYINNRNGAEYTEGYCILEINGKYYGINKRVDSKKDRYGDFSGVSTKTTYHELDSYMDELTEDNNIDLLEENRRGMIQKIIGSVVGSYDNFMRVVLTTSDTLNKVLSSDPSEFMDSLLFDSGLDVFDKKLTNVKKYEKEINEKGRVTCDVDSKNESIIRLNEEIFNLKNEIKKIEKEDLVSVQTEIDNKTSEINILTRKLYNIDSDIYNLDVNSSKTEVESYRDEIDKNNDTINALFKTNEELIDFYDEKRLIHLEKEKSNHKEREFEIILKKRKSVENISKHEHSIELVKRRVFELKEGGKELKEEVITLKNSKKCSQCGQELTDEHKKHMQIKIDGLLEKAYKIKDDIEYKEKVEIGGYEEKIKEENNLIKDYDREIQSESLKMGDVLEEIGKLINQKNDVEKREKNETKIKELKYENENFKLKIEILDDKIKKYNDSLLNIKENNKTNKLIDELGLIQKELENKKTNYQNSIYEKNIEINNRESRIREMRELIQTFKEQEKRDEIFSHYKKCVHREGIPKQMLVNYIIPKINRVMDDLLEETTFRIWLDEETLRPKLLYTDRPNAIIDCIGASGKERTFSSIVLKFALNQINIKSKPKIFMVDEIMGKLDLDGSVEEFRQILHTIKNNMNRVLVVEHNHSVVPDYLINIQLNDNNVSEAVLIEN